MGTGEGVGKGSGKAEDLEIFDKVGRRILNIVIITTITTSMLTVGVLIMTCLSVGSLGLSISTVLVEEGTQSTVGVGVVIIRVLFSPREHGYYPQEICEISQEI